jgi:hypothetical protein
MVKKKSRRTYIWAIFLSTLSRTSSPRKVFKSQQQHFLFLFPFMWTLWIKKNTHPWCFPILRHIWHILKDLQERSALYFGYITWCIILLKSCKIIRKNISPGSLYWRLFSLKEQSFFLIKVLFILLNSEFKYCRDHLECSLSCYTKKKTRTDDLKNVEHIYSQLLRRTNQ